MVVIIMAWIGVTMSAILTFGHFLVLVRYFNRTKSYARELCDLYLLKHMLPDGHPFGFMYKGLPRNRLFPRLFWPCIATFVCTGIVLISAVLATVLSINGILGDKTADTVFVSSSIGATIVAELGLMAIPMVQNRICFKRMFKTDVGLGFNIREEIEKRWPGFYKIDN